MPYSIMLDAGHGGRDPGAVYQDRQEKDDALALVLAVGEILQNNGINVEYTRTEDIYETPFQKATEANAAGVNFFISIHRNSFPEDNVTFGVESLVYDKSGIKYELAEDINEQLESIGFVNLGVKERPNLVVLRRTKMPAVLVEVGFINSDVDNALFDDNFQDIAQAIASGILDTLEIDERQPSQPVMPPASERPDMTPPPRPESPVMSPTIPSSAPGLQYHVQTGAFRMEMYAQRLLNELLEQDFPARIEHTGGFYRVWVGPFSLLDDAVQMERRLKRAGYPTVIVA